MIKKNNKGFILAETLVVTVFLMYIFTMLYANFYPLIGEYEKRERYDDVNSKYKVFWLKKMIEDESYVMSLEEENNLNNKGYVKFKCDLIKDASKIDMCKELIDKLKANCETKDNCDIFITNYQIGDITKEKATDKVYLKDTVRNDNNKVFKNGLGEYILTLPNYSRKSTNGAKYRVIATFKNDNIYSYATMEVDRK